MNFIDPKGQYDTSKYTGISFCAKRGENSTGKVRLKVPDVNTDPDGGMCTECFNDFGARPEPDDRVEQVHLPVPQDDPAGGLGRAAQAAHHPSKMYGVQWQVNVPGANYDIWVDDLQFVCQ